MSAYNELGSGNVWTPESMTVIHFGSPTGTTYNNEENDNGNEHEEN